MESLIATAFGRYVNLQRGEADELTEDAGTLFTSGQEDQALSPDIVLALICKFYGSAYMHLHGFFRKHYLE